MSRFVPREQESSSDHATSLQMPMLLSQSDARSTTYNRKNITSQGMCSGIKGIKRRKVGRKTKDVLEQISILSSHPSPGSLRTYCLSLVVFRELCYSSAWLLITEVSLDGYQIFLKT